MIMWVFGDIWTETSTLELRIDYSCMLFYYFIFARISSWHCGVMRLYSSPQTCNSIKGFSTLLQLCLQSLFWRGVHVIAILARSDNCKLTFWRVKNISGWFFTINDRSGWNTTEYWFDLKSRWTIVFRELSFLCIDRSRHLLIFKVFSFLLKRKLLIVNWTVKNLFLRILSKRVFLMRVQLRNPFIPNGLLNHFYNSLWSSSFIFIW